MRQGEPQPDSIGVRLDAPFPGGPYGAPLPTATPQVPPPFFLFLTFHLVELREVRPVHRLVAEDPVDGEVLCGVEALLRQAVQHAGRHRRGVRAQQVLLGLGHLGGVKKKIMFGMGGALSCADVDKVSGPAGN